VLLLGEALGAREAQIGAPFVGDSGVQLNRTLQRVQCSRNEFRINNVCRCKPPQNWLDGAPWEGDAINNCSSYFADEINRFKPKVVVPLGNVPMNFLLGVKGIEDRRGYVYTCTYAGHSFHVVPTYHPSFIMRGNQNLTDVHSIDIKRALRVVREGYREPDCRYLEHPSGDDLQRFYEECKAAADRGEWLAFDIETPHSGGATEDDYGNIIDTDILRVSASFRPHYSITIPWTHYTFEWIERILALPWAHTVFWNQEFDVPRLQSKGLEIGNPLDAMYMWHFLQSDLPKGLGYVATFFTELKEWKSLSQDLPEYYSCKDADATIQITLKVKKLLEEQGRMEAFISHYVELMPYVISMANSGVLLDQEQQAKFRNEVETELGRIDDEIQKAVPLEVKGVKYRKSIPPDAELGKPVRLSDPNWYWDFDRDTGEWIEHQHFLYSSSQQVVRYMRHMGHPVPTNYKTGKDTTGAAEIEKLADKFPDDPLYVRILDARGFKKIIGTYINGYVPGPDGRIRSHYNRKPSTFRYNSENPNIQNVMKHSSLSDEYRKQFIAAPGCVLVELDFKSLEAQIVGFLAEDPDYIRAAKLGVHAILQSHVMGRPISLSLKDRDIKEMARGLKRLDATLYDACKHTVHLSNYLGSPKRMRMEYPDLFKTVGEAKKLQDMYFATIAKKVKTWQQKMLYTAYQPPHCLTNSFGYRHYFFDVLHYRGQQLEWGTDAKKAVAFLPQSSGAGVISEALKKLAKIPEIFGMVRMMIHDSLVCEVPIEKLVWAVGILKECMEAPLPQLGGLSIEVEVVVGRSWGTTIDYSDWIEKEMK
jgi:uracil-DNA glycosylase family 4